MRDKLIKAVQEHMSRQHRSSGFFLVTFQDGQAIVSGETDGEDATAGEIIRLLADCMTDEADDQDAIGPCLGTA